MTNPRGAVPDPSGRSSLSGSPDLFSLAFDSAPVPLLMRDPAGRALRGNAAFLHFVVRSPEEIVGKPAADFCPPELAEAFAAADAAGGGEFPAASRTVRFSLSREGQGLLFALSVAPLVGAGGGLSGTLATVADLSPLADADQRVARLMRLKDAILSINSSILALSDAGQLYDVILEKVLGAIDHADVGCVLLRTDEGDLRIASSRGYPPTEAAEFRVRLEDTFQWKKSGGHLDETLIINDLLEFMRSLGIPSDILRDADGREIRSSMSAPIIVGGEFLGLINLDSASNNVFDETDRTLVEYVRLQVPIVVGMFRAWERVKELLAEKELILTEVHHRIKNNMGTIYSVLRLQGDSLEDPASRASLLDACSRVQSMSILYERLYLTGDFRAVSLAQFLPELIDRILENFPAPRELRVEKRIEDVRLQAKHLQPFGIIVNELLTNAMKYAFVGRDSGRISVSAFPQGDSLRLEVSDDGAGMPEGIGFGRNSGFGLLLVENLASQMRGTVSILRSGGTTYRFDFPLSSVQAAGPKPPGGAPGSGSSPSGGR